MATLENIHAKLAKLQAQAEALAVTKSTAALEQIRGLMDKHGLVLADILPHIGKPRGRKPGAKATVSAAKYRYPKSGATWTEHGRAPAWIANVKDRSKFLVVKGAVSTVEKKSNAKA